MIRSRGELRSCISSFRRSSQDLGSTHAKSITRLLKQFLGNSEIYQSRVDVLVAEICSQVRETRLRIDAFAVPGQHSVHDEGMSQVVNAGSYASCGGFESRAPQNADQQTTGPRA